MTGETDLKKILATLSPQLDSREYVFCTFKNAVYGDYAQLQPIALFREDEGLSLVVEKSCADREGIDYQAVFKCISLNVHSSLQAVGLTAAVSSLLAEQGISANMIAAYYHDHIFVPAADAEQALALLQSDHL